MNRLLDMTLRDAMREAAGYGAVLLVLSLPVLAELLRGAP